MQVVAGGTDQSQYTRLWHNDSMKQDKYDEPAFFLKYSEMPRSTGGLAEAGEWPAFRELLPDLAGKRVLDLGCGFGWHCRYVTQQGARLAVGVDISEKMLARARETTNDTRITYLRCAIEDFAFAAAQFDLVISSLALHYVGCFDVICQRVYGCLATGGIFVLSVEHPVFTCMAAQEWCLDSDGQRKHWPVDEYFQEGPRNTRWMTENVIKNHRTAATYVNTLVEAGFSIRRLVEPRPLPEHLARHPDWKDEDRRPMFLLISAAKP